MALNPNAKLYRLATMARSFKALYQLSPQQVDAFVRAYDIYDCEWINNEAMKDSQQIEYSQVKKSIIDWYSVLNHLCAMGQVEKMYIPPAMDLSKNVIQNQMLFEERFSQLLGIKTGTQVFELGCGKGRVAAHLASITGANITGINIDEVQLNSAKEFARNNGLSQLCHFSNADLNDLPFPYGDQCFDSIYEIQALSLSRNIEHLFQELYRILKPGGRVSLLEWVRLPNYNPKNPHHVALMKQVKPLIGAIGTPSPAEYESALQKAGFEVIISEDPSVNKSQVPLIDKAGHYFDKISPLIHFLVKIKLLPPHFNILFEQLSKNSDALCEADRLGLVTMCYHLVAEKRD